MQGLAMDGAENIARGVKIEWLTHCLPRKEGGFSARLAPLGLLGLRLTFKRVKIFSHFQFPVLDVWRKILKL